MRKSPFTEHQIIAVIKSLEYERTVKDVCWEAGFSEATYYNWRSRYGGMESSDIKKIKDLEDENQRLRYLFVDLIIWSGFQKMLGTKTGLFSEGIN